MDSQTRHRSPRRRRRIAVTLLVLAGALGAVGALAVAGDGSLLVADGSNRIDRFAPGGALASTWGGSGTGVGQFRFGGGRGNDAGAGGGLAASGETVYVADS